MVVAWRQKARLEALAHYGGVCACCAESEPMFLAFDHVDGNGNQHRKLNKITGGNGMAVWLKRHGFPDGFQVLCANCNIGKHLNHGVCPHQQKEDEK